MNTSDIKIAMSDDELCLLVKHLENAELYLEYGAGGSSVLATRSESIKKIVSVESSAEFVEHLIKSHPELSEAQAKQKLRFQLVDIGKTGDWGRPVDDSRKAFWPNYSLLPFAEGQNNGGLFDTILVDGRFRVACCLAAYIGGADQMRLLVHDFTSRKHYGVILNFYDIIECVGTLVVLKRKQGLPKKAVFKALRKYQYMPDDLTGVDIIKGKMKEFLRK